MRTESESTALEYAPFSLAVASELGYQNREYGTSDAEWTWAEWSLIFGEEVGEVIAALKTAYWDTGREELVMLRSELIQVAALCQLIVAQVDARLADWER